MTTPEDVLTFWLDEVGPKGWYATDPKLDAQITVRFGAAWNEARDGAFGLWLLSPRETLAYLILSDQFPRNMFRERADAFATDASALAAAKGAISKDWDMTIPLPQRQFFYLPLMHAEDLADQDLGIDVIGKRMPDATDTLLHARAHRQVIADFGRFPFRNAALGRTNTPEEQAFLDAGAYGAIVRALQAQS